MKFMIANTSFLFAATAATTFAAGAAAVAADQTTTAMTNKIIESSNNNNERILRRRNNLRQQGQRSLFEDVPPEDEEPPEDVPPGDEEPPEDVPPEDEEPPVDDGEDELPPLPTPTMLDLNQCADTYAMKLIQLETIVDGSTCLWTISDADGGNGNDTIEYTNDCTMLTIANSNAVGEAYDIDIGDYGSSGIEKTVSVTVTNTNYSGSETVSLNTTFGDPVSSNDVEIVMGPNACNEKRVSINYFGSYTVESLAYWSLNNNYVDDGSSCNVDDMTCLVDLFDLDSSLGSNDCFDHHYIKVLVKFAETPCEYSSEAYEIDH